MSDSSTSSARCKQCGAPMTEAPEGLCPRCVMAQVMQPTGESGAAASPPPSPEELAPHFPQLEILECLGRGGMGVVYKARQKSLNRLVALKLLAPERETDPEFAQRFAHEAQALAALSHPSIVTVHEFGRTDGLYFLIMEFVDGVNLRQAMKAGRFTPKQALAIVPPVCDALQFAHDHGIVHRDIKPENLLLDKNGRIKIADFGIAKMIATPSRGSEDQKGITPASATVAVGTPDYAAPEQRAANGEADHRADIYSLGVVLYEMLTGERPKDKIEPPSRRVQVDIRIDEIVMRALEKNPELRFATAAEFRTQVETLADSDRGQAKEREHEQPAMRRIDWVPALVLYCMTSVLWLVHDLAAVRHRPEIQAAISLPLSTMWIVTCVLWSILHYRCWRALPARHRSTTPGRAIGLLYVPVFNFYWAFVSFVGLADGFNAAAKGCPDLGLKNARGLAIAYAVIFIPYFTLAWTPAFGIAVNIADLIVFVLLYRTFVANANALIAPAGQEPSSSPASWRPTLRKWAINAALGVVLAFAVRLFIQPFVAATDAAAPEIPRGSRFLVWRLARDFQPGDLVAYTQDSQASLGRVVRGGAGHLEISRNGGATLAVPRSQVLGKVISVYWRNSESAAVGHVTERSTTSTSPQFGPLVEQVVEMTDTAAYHGLDLETNQFFEPSRWNLRSPKAQLREQGVDLYYDPRQEKWRANGMKILPQNASINKASLAGLLHLNWDNLSPNEKNISVGAYVSQRFLTTEGSRGVLQLTELVGLPRRVRIQYRLAQEVAKPQATAVPQPSLPNPTAALDLWPAMQSADQTLGNLIRNKNAIGALAWIDSTMLPQAHSFESYLAGTPLEERIRIMIERMTPLRAALEAQDWDRVEGLYSGNPDSALEEDLRNLAGVPGSSSQPASKPQHFASREGMENETHWAMNEKPSDLNPKGWVMLAYLTLGGTAPFTLPGTTDECRLKLLKGDDRAITVEIDDIAASRVLTFDLGRDHPAQITINGQGYRLLFPTTRVALNQPDSTPFAFVIVKPAAQ